MAMPLVSDTSSQSATAWAIGLMPVLASTALVRPLPIRNRVTTRLCLAMLFSICQACSNCGSTDLRAAAAMKPMMKRGNLTLLADLVNHAAIRAAGMIQSVLVSLTVVPMVSASLP